MKRLVLLTGIAVLFAAGPARAETLAPGHTVVLSMTFTREYIVGGRMPANFHVTRNTGYRVHVTPKADGTATAIFYNRMGQRLATVRGVVEAAVPEARASAAADPDAKIPWAIRSAEDKTWLAIGAESQRQVLIELFDPPGNVAP